MQSVTKHRQHIPVSRAVPVLTDAERIEAKRQEKMQSNPSSQRLYAPKREAETISDQDEPSEVDRLLG